jgi:hypothetical protein
MSCFQCGTPPRETFQALISTQIGTVVVCPQGHRQFIIIQEPGYALLFERALQNLTKGLMRDAVLDAYTAFDMFLGHVPARARYDREPGASPMRIREEMKQSTQYSERALGAALAMASLVSGHPPPKIDSKLQKIRNEAIHQGKYPTGEEAEWVCFEVERLVRDFEAALAKQPCANAQSYALASHLETVLALDDQGAARVFMGFMCVLDSTHGQSPSAKERLAQFKAGVVLIS